MVLDNSLLYIHHYKVRIKGKVGQSGGVAPSPTPWGSSYWWQRSPTLLYNKNNFNLIEIFVLRLFQMVANQTECSRLEQRSFTNFSWLRSANHMKLTKQCDICTKKYFSQKNVYQLTKHRLTTMRIWVEKSLHEVEIKCLSSKKKFRAQWSIKKGIITIGATINCFLLPSP